jgi:hypothetical protein
MIRFATPGGTDGVRRAMVKNPPAAGLALVVQGGSHDLEPCLGGDALYEKGSPRGQDRAMAQQRWPAKPYLDLRGDNGRVGAGISRRCDPPVRPPLVDEKEKRRGQRFPVGIFIDWPLGSPRCHSINLQSLHTTTSLKRQ